jgi:hypothetical protein
VFGDFCFYCLRSSKTVYLVLFLVLFLFLFLFFNFFFLLLTP